MGRHKRSIFQKILRKAPLIGGFFDDNYADVTPEHRVKALEIRQKRAEIKLKKLAVEEAKLDKEINNIELPTTDEIFAKFFNILVENMTKSFKTGSSGTAGLSQKATANVSNIHPQSTLPSFETISEDEITARLSQMSDREINWLQSKSDAELTTLGKEQLGLSGQNLSKAIQVLRTWQKA